MAYPNNKYYSKEGIEQFPKFESSKQYTPTLIDGEPLYQVCGFPDRYYCVIWYLDENGVIRTALSSFNALPKPIQLADLLK